MLLVFHKGLTVMWLATTSDHHILLRCVGVILLRLLSDSRLVICQSRELIHIQSKRERYGRHALVHDLTILL